MAIKGKSKSRGGSKPVTRGPKPAYVPVKKPLLARRGVWWGTLAVIGVLVVAGLWYGFAKEASQNRADELAREERTAATSYMRKVDPILQTAGQSTQPGVFQVVTGFEQSLSDFVDGKGDAKQIEGAAAGAAQVLGPAASSLDKIDASVIVRDRGFSRDLVLYYVNSQRQMTQAMKLYEQAAILAQQAATAEGDQAVALGTSAKAVLDVARELFADGYADYVETQVAGGVYQPQMPGGQPPLPTGANP